jgi:hypothetical protein
MGWGRYCRSVFLFVQLILLGTTSYALASEEEPCPETRFLMETYIDRVMEEVKPYYSDWSDDLTTTLPIANVQGVRLHAVPFNERWLKERKRSWLLFWRKKTNVPRPSRKHLNTIESIANDVSVELCVRQSCGGNRYPWTEQNIFEFEKAVFGRISDAVADFDLKVQAFHEDHRPPSDFEFENLLQEYLRIWSLGALLDVESERFLSAFPLSTPHRDGVNSRRRSYSELIGDCRIAIIRMANPNYRW